MSRLVLFPIGVVILIPISAAKSDDPSVNNDINSTNIDNHFTITALHQSTQVYPHADHSHLSHYGGFYFSYLYSRAFAHLIKSHLFDSILQTNNNMKIKFYFKIFCNHLKYIK